jgi:hypothetical protein
MPFSPGDKLGPYELGAPTGKGGMGEVWKAHDPRLNRGVAIKVSAEQFSERFEREAKAIAALNHPNICQIYDSHGGRQTLPDQHHCRVGRGPGRGVRPAADRRYELAGRVEEVEPKK